MDFSNKLPFKRSPCFYEAITGNFKRFQYLTLSNFLKYEKLFRKNGMFFQLKVLGLKSQHFYTKLSCQNPMLRQTEWGVQNTPITKNEFLPVTTLSFENHL